ncbi:MAG: replication protein [Cytophagaceae bacterium]|nr:MAG: replication protein [Cytophagaceae bacterium]
MIDTVKLASPHISEADAQLIERACVLRSEVEVSSGDVHWQITTASLAGSYDHRVSVRVEREEWQSTIVENDRGKSVVTGKAPCAPYIVIEGSVHKALLGHNVFGGPQSVALSCCWFVDHVGSLLGVQLPHAEDFTCERMDVATAFKLPSYEACAEFVGGLNLARFPRRKVIRYGDESLLSPGTTTAFKVYHKGPEFSAHDRKRLREHMEPSELLALQEQANCILRLETSIKAKKLQADFKRKPVVVDLDIAYLERVHDRETARLLREADNDVETVRNCREVSRRLHERYESRLAKTLLGTWMQLAGLGEAEVRRTMSKPTWYRQRKQLTDAGVAWLGTDVHIDRTHSAIPLGFSPVRSDRHRLTEQAESVSYTLGTYTRPGMAKALGFEF